MTPLTATESVGLELRRTFPVSPQRVFQAWTDPEELKKWFGPPGHRTTSAEIDLRVGGNYRFAVEQESGEGGHVVVGAFREVTPPVKLVFTWRWEGSEDQETLVTLDFLARGDQTELVLTHERFADAATRDRHIKGWSGTLDCLGELLP